MSELVGADVPPAYVIAGLKQAGYVEFPIDSHQIWYRLPGHDPVRWQDAVVQMGSMVQKLTEQNLALKQAGPLPFWRDPKMLAVAIPAVTTAGYAMSGQFDAFLTMLPPIFASGIKLVVGFVTVGVTTMYAKQHNDRALEHAEAIKQVEKQDQDKGGGPTSNTVQ